MKVLIFNYFEPQKWHFCVVRQKTKTYGRSQSVWGGHSLNKTQWGCQPPASELQHVLARQQGYSLGARRALTTEPTSVRVQNPGDHGCTHISMSSFRRAGR